MFDGKKTICMIISIDLMTRWLLCWLVLILFRGLPYMTHKYRLNYLHIDWIFASFRNFHHRFCKKKCSSMTLLFQHHDWRISICEFWPAPRSLPWIFPANLWRRQERAPEESNLPSPPEGFLTQKTSYQHHKTSKINYDCIIQRPPRTHIGFFGKSPKGCCLFIRPVDPRHKGILARKWTFGS